MQDAESTSCSLIQIYHPEFEPHSEYLNQLSETIDIRRNVRKKDNFFEADISAANGGTNCRVYERFSIFQIIGKNPKFKNIFIDEKSCKV